MVLSSRPVDRFGDVVVHVGREAAPVLAGIVFALIAITGTPILATPNRRPCLLQHQHGLAAS